MLKGRWPPAVPADVLAVHRVVTRALSARYIAKARRLGVSAPRLCTLVPRPGKNTIGVDVLACPRGKRRRFIELVMKKDKLRPLLRAYDQRDEPLPLRKARSPPHADLDFGA